MITRELQKTICRDLQQFPVVAIIGSRQIGKTTMAKQIAADYENAIYLDLELPRDLEKLIDRPEVFLENHQNALVVLDEVQRRPDLFPILRGLIDRARRPGRFLVLGSASPDLLRQTSESLAGRIIYHELTPITLGESQSLHHNYEHLWLRGGYPDSHLATDQSQSVLWRQAFLQSYRERDLKAFGVYAESRQLDRLLSMLAHTEGQLLNAHNLSNSLDMATRTLNRYLDILESTFLIRRLPPYWVNIKKRLIKSPKLYYRDSGLLHSVINLDDREALYAHPGVGASFEGFVIEEMTKVLPSRWQYYFYRTSAGAEIDLILIPPGGGAPIAVEIKYSLAPRLSRGFHIAYSDLECERGYLIYPGEDDYPITETVSAWPLVRIKEIIEPVSTH